MGYSALAEKEGPLEQETKNKTPGALVIANYATAGALASLTLLFAAFPGLLAALPGQASLLEKAGYVGEVRSLLVMTFPLSLVDAYAAKSGDLGLMGMSIIYRLGWMLPWIVACSVRSGEGGAVVVFLLLLTVGTAVPNLVLLPDKATVLPQFFAMFKPPLTEHHGSIGNALVNHLAVIGIALSCLTTTGAAFSWHFVSSEDLRSVAVLALAVPGVYCFVLLRLSVQTAREAHLFGITLLSAVVAAAVLWGTIASLPIQITYSYQAFACISLGTLAFSTLWQFLVAPEDLSAARMSPGSFAVGVAVCMALEASILTSARFLFSKSSQEIAWRVAREEICTACLMTIFGLVCLQAGSKGELSKWAYYVSLLNPWINVWFFCQGPVMALSGYGSPMKQSWTFQKFVPMYGENEAMNFTYWFTGLTTGGLNTAAMYMIFKMAEKEGWANLSRHGAMMLITCGWFFGFVVAGVKHGCKAWGPATDLPPLVEHVDYLDALAMHRVDAGLSLCLMAGGLLFSRVMPKETDKMALVVLAAAWLCAAVPKFQLIAFEVSARMSLD